MSNATVSIRKLRAGFYYVTVGGKSRTCISLMQAAEWAEKQLEALKEQPEGPGPTK